METVKIIRCVGISRERKSRVHALYILLGAHDLLSILNISIQHSLSSIIPILAICRLLSTRTVALQAQNRLILSANYISSQRSTVNITGPSNHYF